MKDEIAATLKSGLDEHSQSPNTTRFDPGDRFRKIVEEVDEYAIIYMEKDGTIVTWNKGAERIKGYRAEEIIGKPFRLFYTRDEKEANFPEQLLETARESGKVRHEGWRVRRDGTRFWGNVTITAIHDEHNNVTGFLKVTHDMTDSRIAQDRVNNYTEEIRLKNAELSESQQRYSQMIAEIREYAIILLDCEGKILDWNKGAEQLKGYRADEIVGKSFRLFYTKEDRDAGLPDKLLKEATSLGSVTHEGWRVRKDGKRFWSYVSITALHNDKREVFGFSKITRDLTEKRIAEDRISNYVEELKQSNEQLRQSEERYHRMIEEVQDYAIIFISLNGVIQNWNTGAEKINGYAREEAVGKDFRMFYTTSDLKKGLPEALLEEARRNGRAVNEGYRVRKDGSCFWASVVITALHDNQNRIIGYSKVTRDLTERKMIEESLDAKNRDLEILNGELSSFAYIASHDLKEPLRKIQVYASRIAHLEQLSQRSADHVQKIQLSATRMQQLIDDLLSFSKLSRTDELTTVDLNQILAEVKNDLEITINEKKATIRFESLPTIRGTPFQLHQVFLNLISNSLKFSRPEVSPIVQVRYSRVTGPVVRHEVPDSREYHRLTITDNGIGFNESEGKRIFNVFYRLHSRESFEGAGIGLAIVKKVIDNHRGFIAPEGRPGDGATFYVYLPA